MISGMYFLWPNPIFLIWLRSFLNKDHNHEITFSLSQEITKELITALKTEKYDVIFGSKVPDETEIEFIPVVNQEMVIITPPGTPIKI